MSWLDAIILGLVEGITEFLPISSTGHLILTKSWLGLEGDAIDRLLIVIQGAAILAVCWEYRERLWHTALSIGRETRSRLFVLNLFIAFLPLAILGLLLEERIEAVLFSPIPVAIALVAGGLLILWAEKRQHVERVTSVDELTWRDALTVGLFQALALIPGTSRSAATILGGLLTGLNRRTAAEFSFFLAMPTMAGAFAYDLFKNWGTLRPDDMTGIAIGFVVAFIAAVVVVRYLLDYVSRHGFSLFAWWRIIVGTAGLAGLYLVG